MKKILLSSILAVFAAFPVFAQSGTEDGNHLLMKTIFRLDGSFEQYDVNGTTERTLSPSNSELYTILDGNLADNLALFGSFHWLNSSPASLYQNLGKCGASTVIDILTLTYTFGNNMYLTAGKDFMAVGGFEQDPSSSMVYYDVASNNWNMMPVYMYGGRIGYRFGNDGCQDSFLQIIESPFKDKVFSNGLVTASLGWNGRVTPNWKTMYSATFQQTGDAHEKDIFMLSIGNCWKAGNCTFTLDLMPRAYGLNDFFNQEFTSVTDIRYSFPKVDAFFKGGWEFCHNEDNMYCSNGSDITSWNIGGSICPDHIYKDRDYIFGSFGLEYFPLADRTLRLTLFAATNNYCIGGGAIVASVRYSLETFLY